MREINFFSPYIEKENKSRRVRKRIIMAAVLVLFVSVGISGFLFAELRMLQEEVISTEAYLESPEVQIKLKEMENMKNRMEAGSIYLSELEDLQARIQAVDLINVKLMDTIASTLPSGTVLTDMALNVDTVELSGYAPSNTNIAEVEYNLKKTGRFSHVHVSQIKNEDGLRQFTLTGTLQ